MAHQSSEGDRMSVQSDSCIEWPSFVPIKKIRRSRAAVRKLMHLEKFHYTIISVVLLDLVAVFIDLVIALLSNACLSDEELKEVEEKGGNPEQNRNCVLKANHSLEVGEDFLFWFSVILLLIFVMEILTAFYAFGYRRFLKPLYAVDAIVVIASLILELYFHVHDERGRTSPAALVILRLWKIIRAIHAIAHSVELKNQSIIRAVEVSKEGIEREKEELLENYEREKLKVMYLRTLVPNIDEAQLKAKVDEAWRERERILLDEGKAIKAETDESTNVGGFFSGGKREGKDIPLKALP